MRDALGPRGQGHRHHRPRGHPRGRRRADPRPGGRAGPARRHRGDRCTSASSRSSAGSTPPPSDGSSTSSGKGRPAGEGPLSVYDKSGVVDSPASWPSSAATWCPRGGTAARCGRPAWRSPTWPSSPASEPILGHRVVTLHPKVHGGILADPTDPAHPADMAAHGIEPFDLVVANLYPFGTDPADFEHGAKGAEDLIDIGGPAMIRAAAKNHAHVGVLADPADYPAVLEELRADGGCPTPPGGGWPARRSPPPPPTTPPSSPGSTRPGPSRATAARVAPPGLPARAAGPALRREPPPAGRPATARRAPTRGGPRRAPSTAAWRSATSTSTTPTPPGCSSTTWPAASASRRRHHQARQPVRRRGGRHAGRRLPAGLRVRRAVGLRRHRRPQPPGRRGHGRAHGRRRPGRRRHRPGYAHGVGRGPRGQAQEHPRARGAAAHARPLAPPPDHRRLLVQEPHRFVAERADWRVVTERQPTEAELADAELAWRVCGWVKSNAIVLAKDGVGLGHRRRPAEPGRVRRAGRGQGRRPGRGRRLRQRRLLPVPRRHRGRRRRRRGRDHPARRVGERRREHRQGRRAGRGHGLHRRAALPALIERMFAEEVGRVRRVHPCRDGVRPLGQPGAM